MKDRSRRGARKSKARIALLIGIALLIAALGYAFGPKLLRPGSKAVIHEPLVSNIVSATPTNFTPAPLSPALTNTLSNIFAGINTNDPVQLHNYGSELLNVGRPWEAIRVYIHAIKLTPEDEELHFNLAYAFAKVGQTNEAIAEYTEAIRLFPDFAEAHNNIGNLLIGLRQHEKALEHFSAALKVTPDSTSAMNNIGRVLAEQGRTKEAINYFNDAVRLNPEYLEARYNLGTALLADGNVDAAIAEFNEVLKREPNFTPALRGLARAREKKAAATQ